MKIKIINNIKTHKQKNHSQLLNHPTMLYQVELLTIENPYLVKIFMNNQTSNQLKINNQMMLRWLDLQG